MAGRGATLKESVLAHELYGKGTDFDGGTDPVVRVDARRLRDKLREFYEGRSDPVVISLPKGSYAAVFEEHSSSLIPGPQGKRSIVRLTRTKTLLSALTLVVLAVTIVIAWRALRGPAATPAQLHPLASYPGLEGPPSLSPDGELVAFAWSGANAGGPTDLYVKAVGSEALRRLTETADWESSAAWSPDGHSIAFVREGHGVFTLSQLGGAERQVSASGTHVAWADDSKSVLIRDREGDTGPFGIYQVFLDTLDRRRLTQAPVGAGDWRFEVSPDGKTLALIRYERHGIADLYVMPKAGGEPRRLSNWNAALTGLAWTPDSREIVYSVEEPAAGRLWRIPANSARPARGSPIADIPAPAENPSISRPLAGQPARLAFQTVTRDVDTFLMDLESAAATDTIESNPFANSTRIEASARFSPDGSRIAFASSRSGSPEIWVAGRDGNGLRQITSLGAAQLVVGGWSPNGAGSCSSMQRSTATATSISSAAEGGRLRRLTSEVAIDGHCVMVGRRALDLFHVDTHRSDSGHLARSLPMAAAALRMTRNGGFEPKASSDGRYLFYLERHPSAWRPTALRG